MSKTTATLVAVALTFAAIPAFAQPAPLADDAGNRPVVEASTDEKTPPPAPRLHMFTDNAGISPHGWVGVEGNYQAAFHRCVFDLDREFLIGGARRCTLHTPALMASFAPIPWLETRLGLQAYSASGYQDIDWIVKPTIVDRVDIFLEVKGAIPLDIDEPERHQLAVLATIRPGAGYSFPRESGGVIAGYAIYSTSPGPVRVDVQAGVKFRGLFDDLSLAMPLSAAISWRALPWLEPFGELIEELDFRDLSASQTSIRIGSLFWVDPHIALTAGTQIGLSESLLFDATLELGVSANLARVLR